MFMYALQPYQLVSISPNPRLKTASQLNFGADDDTLFSHMAYTGTSCKAFYLGPESILLMRFSANSAAAQDNPASMYLLAACSHCL